MEINPRYSNYRAAELYFGEEYSPIPVNSEEAYNMLRNAKLHLRNSHSREELYSGVYKPLEILLETQKLVRISGNS